MGSAEFVERKVSVALALTLLMTLTTFVYWPGLDGGFIFDDFPNIVYNTGLHVHGTAWQDWLSATLSTETGPLQRPLAMFSFALNYFFTGLDPWPMKASNLAIHLLNATLIFGLSRSIFIALAGRSSQSDQDEVRIRWAALFVAAIWVLHPINLMAVLYIVQRMESLCHVFVFAGLWLYVWGRHRQLAGAGGWPAILAGILGGTFLGVLSKESAILLPLYAFLVEACVFRFRMPGHSRISKRLSALYGFVLLLPALAAASVLLPRYLAVGAYGSREFSLVERLLTEARVLIEYLRWSVLPDLRQLSLYHDDFPISRGLLQPLSTLFALLALAALLVVAWLCRKRRPLTSLGILWFLAAHLLTATIIPLELMFEHRNYFASLGICLVLADWLLFAPASQNLRKAGALGAVIFVVFFAGLTHLRALEWSHPLRFAITEVAKHPASPRATYDLARNLVGLTNYEADSPYTRDAWQALERARDAPGSDILPDQAALIFAARTGKAQDRIWWDDMQAKLRRQALSASNTAGLVALSNCAVEEDCQFDPNDMVATFSAALEAKPQPDVLSVFGKYALYVLHDPGFALRLWKEAAERAPSNGQFRINLAMLQIDLGMHDDARLQIDQLRKLSRVGRYEQQARHLEQAIARARQSHEAFGGRENTKAKVE